MCAAPHSCLDRCEVLRREEELQVQIKHEKNTVLSKAVEPKKARACLAALEEHFAST